MFCNQCGKEILENSKFCNYCGTEVATVFEKQTENDNEIQKEFKKYFEEGEKFYNDEMYEKAINLFSKALDLIPDSLVFFNRGFCYEAMENIDAAIADYTQAIQYENDPSMLHIIYSARGQVYLGLDEHEYALSDFNEAIRFMHTDPDYYNYRGVVHYALENYDSAISDFEKALKLKPKSKKYRDNLEKARQAYEEHDNNSGIGGAIAGFLGGAAAGFLQAMLEDDDDD